MDSAKFVVDALCVFLKAKMPNLEAVNQEFPAADVLLKYPCVTVTTTGNPEFQNLQPYTLEQGPLGLDHKAEVKRVVGMYDYTLQVDIWAKNKVQRLKTFDEFFQAFNEKISPMGLSLQLEKYHGVWARYDMTSYAFDDSEAGSQRGEWRVRITVLANCVAVLGRREAIMETIEKHITTSETYSG